MITGLSKNPRRYIIKADRKSADPTVFTIKSLSRVDMEEVRQNQTKEERDDPSFYKMTDVYLAKAILGWTTFQDQEGGDVPFSIENISKLPMFVANELFNEVTGSVAPEEIKNSNRQSSSPSGSETSTLSNGTATPVLSVV